MDFTQTDLLDLDVHTFSCEPLYEWLREEAPLFCDPNNEIWAVSRYDDVVTVSMDTELFCSSRGVVPCVPMDVWPDEAMINLDGAEHTTQRALVSKGFTPRMVAELEEAARAYVHRRLDGVAGREAFDLVAELASPLPMRMIGSMLGYPEEIDDKVLGWADVFTMGGCGPEHITEAVVEAFDQFCEFHEEFAAERAESPGSDLLSLWMQAEIDGNRLSEDKILWEHNLLLVGGSETTRNAISLGLLALLADRDQWGWLRRNPQGIPGAVEEMIRWASPFVRMARTLTRDHQWYGHTLEEGQQIVMLYPAANRDPRAFRDPQTFDIRREFDKRPLSFGIGKHYCLGAALARMEVKVVLETLLERAPTLALDPSLEPVYHRSCFTNGLETLPVVLPR